MSKGPGVAFRYIHTLPRYYFIRSSDISAGFFVTTDHFSIRLFFLSGVHMARLGSVRETRQAERKWDANGGH